MNARKVLFPTDFSECSESPLEEAASLALDTGAKLIILHVVEDEARYEDHGYGGFPVIDDEAHLNDELEQVTPSDSRVSYEHRLMHGDPAATILRLADDEQVDFIVMGTHGRRGMMRFLMGSVAEDVVRHAKCPVLTVKQSQHAFH